jgi:hypothetical protein
MPETWVPETGIPELTFRIHRVRALAAGPETCIFMLIFNAKKNKM